MNWADIVPTLLTGLREGLEAGLIVTILLAAVHKTAQARAKRGTGGGETPEIPAAPIWLGAGSALSLSVAFAAALSVSGSVPSGQGTEAADGLLSVLAVCLLTGMIFRLRRTAGILSARVEGEAARATAAGAGALAITAFVSVGRGGLETVLLVQASARASGRSAGPLTGAAIGIAVAAAVCWLLYRFAVRLNAGVLVSRAAIALIVIAAGMLAYGLGELQDATMLPGHAWVAFTLTAHVNPASWWAAVITGVTELLPKMTVLQATAWLAYLVVVVLAFRSPARTAEKALPAAAPAGTAESTESAGSLRGLKSLKPAGWGTVAARRPWRVAGVLAAVPAVVAGVTFAAAPAGGASGAGGGGSTTAAVTVTRSQCAPQWTSAQGGTHTITVTNNSGLAGEVDLDDQAGAVVGEIETIGPGTSAPLTATLWKGTYNFQCLMGSLMPVNSRAVTVSTSAGGTAPAAVEPTTVDELTTPNEFYQGWAAGQLIDLEKEVAVIEADLRHDNLAQARKDWLTAQLDWERVGASYDSFGPLGLAVDGLPDGLAGGVSDRHFTGLHRLEYGLWHGQPASELLPVAETLARNVVTVKANLTSAALAGDPAQLPIRAHEIMEDALRDHLSGIDDEGAGAAYAMTYADTQVDKAVLGYLTLLLNERQPGLVTTADRQLATLDQALLATRANGQWRSLTAVPLSQREHVDAAIGALLETLSAVSDLLEVRPAH